MKRTRSGRSSASSDAPRKRTFSGKGAFAADLRDPSPAEPTPRDYFATLPRESATHIVELACRSSSPSTPSSSAAVTEASNRPPPSRLDVTTTLSLTLVSHSFYDLVVPRLFRNVWLSRPSALERFLSVLEARPHLGGLVKSLYVGPDSAQPTHHSPLANPDRDDDSDTSSAADEDEWERARMSSTLRSAQEAKLLPRWCAPDRRWKLHSPESSVPGRAVHDALLAAQYAIDCYPPGAFIPGEDEEEGAINYCNGEWEVQAALDLYLIEMRRYEDQRGIIDAFSVPEELLDYPELVYTGYPSRSEAGDEEEGEDNDEEENKDKDKDEDQGKNNDEDEGEEDSSTKFPAP